MSPVSRDEFREAMSRLGAAVHIVTTDGPAGRCGFTASAVCPVTDDPPTLLACLNRSSRMNGVFKVNGVLCVNTLTAGHRALSEWFAGFGGVEMAERFRHDRWATLVTDAPVLGTSLVSFDCTLAEVKEVGTHSVMFGAVQAIGLNRREPALVYLNRAYRAVDWAI